MATTKELVDDIKSACTLVRTSGLSEVCLYVENVEQLTSEIEQLQKQLDLFLSAPSSSVVRRLQHQLRSK